MIRANTYSTQYTTVKLEQLQEVTVNLENNDEARNFDVSSRKIEDISCWNAYISRFTWATLVSFEGETLVTADPKCPRPLPKLEPIFPRRLACQLLDQKQ